MSAIEITRQDLSIAVAWTTAKVENPIRLELRNLSEKITRRARALVLEFHIEGGIPISHGFTGMHAEILSEIEDIVKIGGILTRTNPTTPRSMGAAVNPPIWARKNLEVSSFTAQEV